jgi:hypothetical protein
MDNQNCNCSIPAGKQITIQSEVGVRMGVCKTINSAYRRTFQDIPLKNSLICFFVKVECNNLQQQLVGTSKQVNK